jgi:hypothetical protein
VDDYFAASGYMGDGVQPGALTDDATCPERAGEKRGLCHHITSKPGSNGWAGIYWQFPDGNWGMAAGHDVAPGATQITFWAWGAAGGEKVDFFAGMNPPDGFKVDPGAVTLTTTPTQYSLSLQGAAYKSVVGPFGWSAATPGGAPPLVFYVDDLQWR